MSAMIISFADKPQVVQEFTRNRRLLRERLASIQPTARGTDLATRAWSSRAGWRIPASVSSCRAAGDEAAVAQSPPATLYIFSDGRFEDVTGRRTRTTCEPVYVPVGSFRRGESGDHGGLDAAKRRASGTAAVVRAGGQLHRRAAEGHRRDFARRPDFSMRRRSTCRPAKRRASSSRSPRARWAELTARLSYDLDGATRDALRQDDVGYAALNDSGTGRVLVVSPGNVPLELALEHRTGQAAGTNRVRAAGDARIGRVSPRRQRTATYDLIIYDQCAPAEMPRANTFFIGRTAAGTGVARDERTQATKSAADACNGHAARRSDHRSSIGIVRVRCWPTSIWATWRSPTASSSGRRRAAPCSSNRPPGRSPRSRPRDSYQDVVLRLRNRRQPTPTAAARPTPTGRSGPRFRLSGSMCSNIWPPAAKNKWRPRCDRVGPWSCTPRRPPTS